MDYTLLFITETCPDGSTILTCIVNPCQFASCPTFKEATCFADFCGGCTARWLLNGVEVTEQCQGSKVLYNMHSALLF